MDAKTEPSEGSAPASVPPVASSGSPAAGTPLPASDPTPSASDTIEPAPSDDAASPAAAAAQSNGVEKVKVESPIPDAKAKVPPAAQATAAKGDESHRAGPVPPAQNVQTAAAVPPVAASGAASQLVSLDLGEVQMKLQRLFDSWEGKGPNAASASWADVDALCVFVGRSADEDESAAERIQ